MEKAYKEENKEKMFGLYKAIFPYMDKDNFISFEEFCSKSNINNKSQEEILIEVKELLEREWIDGTV